MGLAHSIHPASWKNPNSAIRNPKSNRPLTAAVVDPACSVTVVDPLAELPIHLQALALERAWRGDLSGARADLDEAWEIAERGPMPLFLADIHLYRARLFGRFATDESGSVGRPATADERPATAEGGSFRRPTTAAYPWQSPQQDLAEARRLIETHGYHRRDDELADAEVAQTL